MLGGLPFGVIDLAIQPMDTSTPRMAVLVSPRSRDMRRSCWPVLALIFWKGARQA